MAQRSRKASLGCSLPPWGQLCFSEFSASCTAPTPQRPAPQRWPWPLDVPTEPYSGDEEGSPLTASASPPWPTHLSSAPSACVIFQGLGLQMSTTESEGWDITCVKERLTLGSEMGSRRTPGLG